ncbi:CDP-glycerol glycerophosphotransferase family protein [Eubacterium uniforme]|nr:CDP-glycerol glycerophosphotransferase family protein [Eubacterium uniforme]
MKKQLRNLARVMMLTYKRLLYFLCKRALTPKKNIVFFESYQGKKYACNPKAIYEYMLNDERFKDYTFVWGFRDVSKYQNDTIFTSKSKIGNHQVYLVKYESLLYFKYLAKAGYIITNSNPRDFCTFKDSQVFVQTWHGTPLKKIGLDVNRTGNAITSLAQMEKIYNNQAKRIDYMIAPSEFTKEKLISAFNLSEVHKEDCVLTCGYPRNDILYTHCNDDEYIKKIKEKYNVPRDKKVIMYAPTFRDNKHDVVKGFRANTGFDFNVMKNHFKDYIVLYRSHYFITEKLNLNEYKGFVIDVSDVDDISDLYLISDILITDYSSVFFDYANLKRPILFYMYDLEEYKDEVRDFYFDIEKLPGPIYRTEEEVYKGLVDIENVSEEYQEKYEAFAKEFCDIDDGNASKRFVDVVFKNEQA